MGKELQFVVIPSENDGVTTEIIEPEEIVTTISISSSEEMPTTRKQKYTYDFSDSNASSSSETPQSVVIVDSANDQSEESKTEFPAPVTEDLRDDTPMPTETYFKAPKSIDQRTEVNVMDGFTTPRNADKVPATVYSTAAPIKVVYDETMSTSSESSAELSSSTKSMYAVTEDAEYETGPVHQGDQSPFLPEGENNATLLDILHAGHDVEPQNETDESAAVRTDLRESSFVLISPIDTTTSTERAEDTVLPNSEKIVTKISDEETTEELSDSTELYNLQESRSHNHEKQIGEEDTTLVPADENSSEGSGSNDDEAKHEKHVVVVPLEVVPTVPVTTSSEKPRPSTTSSTIENISVTAQTIEESDSDNSSPSSKDDSEIKLVTTPLVEASSVENATDNVSQELSISESDAPVVILTSQEDEKSDTAVSTSSTENSSENFANSENSKFDNDIFDPNEKFTKSNEFYNSGYLKLNNNDLKVIPLIKENKQNSTETAKETSEKELSNVENQTENVTGHFLDKATFHLAQSSSFETSKSLDKNSENLLVVKSTETSTEAVKSLGLETSSVEKIAAFSRCTAGQFECSNGTSIKDGTSCISFSERCDSIAHCTDNSDEEKCEQLGCPKHFQCKDGPCLSRFKVCDKIAHCIDGSDELPEICGMYLSALIAQNKIDQNDRKELCFVIFFFLLSMY